MNREADMRKALKKAFKAPLMPRGLRRNMTGRFFTGANSELESALEQG
jgi:hypothetical protein